MVHAEIVINCVCVCALHGFCNAATKGLLRWCVVVVDVFCAVLAGSVCMLCVCVLWFCATTVLVLLPAAHAPALG